MRVGMTTRAIAIGTGSGTGSPPHPRGFFVTFEGGEGAGKSTQVLRLATRLRERDIRTTVTREPGGSPRAEAIRHILLSGQAKRFGALAETILFAAARADHVDVLVRPALARGGAVLCDRFFDSTRVYQGEVAGLAAEVVARLERAAVGPLMPDLTLVLDIPAELGLARAGARRNAGAEGPDRFEAEGLAYHDRVRRAFLAIAASEPARCVVIDAAPEPGVVAEAVWAAVTARLSIGGAQGG